MASLKTIAEACGVSVATVSKALNDHKDIGETTKERIREAAKQMGYTPNLAARSLKTNRTYNLGILFSENADSGLKHDYFAGILDSVRRAAGQRGYDITFINNDRSKKDRLSCLAYSKRRQFDGVLIACVDYDEEVEELITGDIPVVMVDHIFNNRCSVVSDNIRGIRDLVEYIYACGHRRIAYIHGEETDVTRNRVTSFHRVCQQLGIDSPAEYLGEAPYRDTETSYRETVRLLELRVPPTCIMYPDDFSCLGGIRAIRERGLRIPEDISVVGYDGIEAVKHLFPKVTTLEQDVEQIGRSAANKLIDLIETPKTTLIDMIVVPGRVYKGESVAKLQ